MAGENINRRLNIYINDREIINSQRGIASEMSRVRNQIRNLDRSAADYNERLAELADTYRMLRDEQQRFNRELNQAPGIFSRIRAALGPVASGLLAAFSISAIASGFTEKMKEAFNVIVDFNQKQADLAAIMGKSRASIIKLTYDAIKYGATTSYNAAEVSVLQTELARLGKTEKEIRAMTGSVLNAATALEADLGPAAELIGGQLNSYQEDASKAGEYSDIMANSVNVSATSFESLATALPKVSKVAFLQGVEFTKLNAVLGVLADENVAAETAGTGFRNILLESAKVGKPYEELLQKIKNSTNQTKTATELFGKENATVAVILANSTQKINDNTKALENSGGAAEKLANEKMNSIEGSVKSFSSAWEGLILTIEKGDGWIGRSIKSMIDFGSSILGVITPTRRLSDELRDEQLNLNMLISRITSSNIKNEERKKLLQDLKEEYPDLVKNINLETVSNEELNKILGKVNEQYIKRIALQEQAEKVEDASKIQGNRLADEFKWREKLFKLLNENKGRYNLKADIDYNDLVKSAKEVNAELKSIGKEGGLGDRYKIEAFANQVETFARAAKNAGKAVDEETEALERQSKAMGIDTEARREEKALLEEKLRLREELIKQATEMGMANARENSTVEIKRWIAAQKEKLMYAGGDEETEKERKKREKAIEDAKKHAEKLLKDEEDLRKKLLEIQRNSQDMELSNLRDGYDKERDEINVQFDRKIEDAKINIQKEQEEIAKLNKAIADESTSGVDRASFKKQLAIRKEIAIEMTDTLVSIEKTRNLKLGTLQEKYLDIEQKKVDEAHAHELNNLQIKNNNELASIKSFKDAKEILSQYLDTDELNKVRTLEDAKIRIKEAHQKTEYEMQEKHLIDMMARIQSIFAMEEDLQIELISPEHRAELLKYLDELALKLSAVGLKKSEDQESSTSSTTNNVKALSGIDLLGFSPEQWASTFSSLDTFAQKIAAVEMVVGAMQNAWGKFFSFFDAKDQISLQKFRASTDRKKRDLSDQLEKGYITQEVYNARVAKLEQDVDKKQAEMEYKKAKRDKIAAAFGIVTQTALGIMKAVAAFPLTGGMPWTAIIGGLGAIELAAVLAQPLPPKSGYFDGGYTGPGNKRNEAGPVHRREYVIPEKVLFSDDPVVPSIIGYVEAKRKGKDASPINEGSDPNSNGGASSGNSITDYALFIQALNRNSEVLEKIEEEGIAAFFELDVKTAKKIREKMKELEKIENTAKK